MRVQAPGRFPRSVQSADRTLDRTASSAALLIFSTSISRLKSMPSRFGHGPERRYILGETRSAMSDSRSQEAWPDPAIQAHAARHLLDVRVGSLAEIRNGIDERYFERQKCVGCVLDDLCRFGRRIQQGRRLRGAEQHPGIASGSLIVCPRGQRRIDVGQQRRGSIVVRADDDAVGVKKVLHCVPCAETQDWTPRRTAAPTPLRLIARRIHSLV